MQQPSLSALITKQGKRVLFRVAGRHYDLDQQDLRSLLEVPAGSPGLGITIDGHRVCFEFTDDHVVELSAKQLERRLAKQATSGA